MGANARRRKSAKLAEHVTAHPGKRCPNVAPRCDVRDRNGHRCNRAPHDKGNHSAFGHEWKA